MEERKKRERERRRKEKGKEEKINVISVLGTEKEK